MRTSTLGTAESAKSAGSASGRQGSLIVELLFVLPILLALLVGMIEFSMLLTVRQQLLAASREGARVASHQIKPDDEEVKAVVKRALGTGTLGDAQVDIYRFPEDPLQPNCVRDRVEVYVHVASDHVVPDLLGWAGVTFRGQTLTAGSIMSVE